MLKWITFLVIIIAGSILSYFYIELKNLEETPTLLPPIETPNTVRIVHSFSDGIHRYTGNIKLPHSCYSLQTQMIQSPDLEKVVTLSIETKNSITEQRFCSQIPTRYQFETIADAPEDVHLILRVDGVVRPTSIKETAWTNPTGTIITK